MSRTFAEKLELYAKLAVRAGVNVQPGQELILSLPVLDVEFGRLLVKEAYACGAKNVQTMYVDEQNTRARYTHGNDAACDYAPQWYFDGMEAAMREGAARLTIYNENPSLLSDIDPAKVGRWSKVRSKVARKSGDLISGFAINWSLISTPSEAWAKVIFPDLSAEQAVAKLWDAIFTACRVDTDDPVTAWSKHADSLSKRAQYLDDLNFSAIHFRGPNTNLKVGLVEGHRWKGGWGTAKNGVKCSANIPTEEVFTMPHRDRVEGYVSNTLPFALRGQVVDGIRMEFKDGVVVKATATQAESTLTGLLDTDEGARRLGEMALVPANCAVAKTGILFYNTLFDENAASHIALGRCYAENMAAWDSLSEADRIKAGANESDVHEDWMIGSASVEVDGVFANGDVKPLLRGEDWVEAL